MEVRVCPIKRLYQIAQDGDLGNVAAVAVSDDCIDIVKLQNFGRLSVHNFADTVDSWGIDAREARKIAAFVDSLDGDIDTLFCCCDAGQSRSPAMAAAICHHLGMDEMRFWRDPRYHPNPAVYQALCRAFDIPLSQELLDVLQQISADSFREGLEG